MASSTVLDTNPKSYFIDVRTPAEFSTGALPGAQNIEYQNVTSFIIDQESAPKHAKITMYCRSGRRSGIAKAELDALGYLHVRDLGSLEMARDTLESESGQTKASEAAKDSARIGVSAEKLKRSTDALMAGLKGLEMEA
jgi:rhodanese-related sulfurtransferase